jgi:hypothetical protein
MARPTIFAGMWMTDHSDFPQAVCNLWNFGMINSILLCKQAAEASPAALAPIISV